jgi:hypothetical protein
MIKEIGLSGGKSAAGKRSRIVFSDFVQSAPDPRTGGAECRRPACAVGQRRPDSQWIG